MVIQNGPEALRSKKDFLEQLVETSRKLFEQGYSERQIASKLLPRNIMLEIMSRGEMSPTHLIRSGIQSG